LLIKFLLGGVIVSLFAAVAETWKPKTFAGVFGAAPSVALASLALAFHDHGGSYVAVEGRSLVAGSVALLAYSAACVFLSKRQKLPIWLGAAAAWAVWAMAALAAWRVAVASGWL
jgi:uncharacterized membrane protein (GlpM family)